MNEGKVVSKHCNGPYSGKSISDKYLACITTRFTTSDHFSNSLNIDRSHIANV